MALNPFPFDMREILTNLWRVKIYSKCFGSDLPGYDHLKKQFRIQLDLNMTLNFGFDLSINNHTVNLYLAADAWLFRNEILREFVVFLFLFSKHWMEDVVTGSTSLNWFYKMHDGCWWQTQTEKQNKNKTNCRNS